ncbi:MAG: hypothetical protein HQ582_10730 [Planctomycetes bacterium]|nr:hypothetical protein [Planctomycetota bacterium]
MKITRKMLLLGVLAALGWSTAWAAEKAPEKAAAVVDAAVETATHEEAEPLAVGFKRLAALRLDRRGRLLAADAEANEIKVISPRGRVIRNIPLDFAPEAIDVATDGTIYSGGEGRLVVVDYCGNVLCRADVPDEATSKLSDRRRRLMRRPLKISGIAVAGSDVFVAFGSGWSTGSKSKLYRFDRSLNNPKLLAEGLRGCCQRCDVAAAGGVVYLAENSAHRVVRCDRDGEVLGKWGERSRTGVEGFGACCNPMNLAFDAQGVLYTAESGLARVKRYSADGEYLGLVGYVGTTRFTKAGHLAASCSNIAIAVTPSGSRVYVMDYQDNLIRVLQKKETDGCSTARPRRRIRILGGRAGRAVRSRGCR